MESFFKWVSRVLTVLGVPALVVIGSIGLAEINALNREVGVLQGQMKAIDVQFEHAKEHRAKIQESQTGAIDGASQRLDQLEKTIRFSQLDIGRMLVKMGMVPDGKVFEAAIIGEAVWVFPADKALAESLEKRGMRRKQINNAISGYTIVPASALIDQ